MANIETITVGDTTYGIKRASGVNYTTAEQDTGLTWIDGKPIYQKTVNCGNLPNATKKEVNANISNLDTIIDIWGISSNGTQFNPINFAYPSSVSWSLGCYYNNGKIQLVTAQNMSAFTTYVTLQYTKTTDV